jgi:hypothetical protein
MREIEVNVAQMGAPRQPATGGSAICMASRNLHVTNPWDLTGICNIPNKNVSGALAEFQLQGNRRAHGDMESPWVTKEKSGNEMDQTSQPHAPSILV